MPAMLAGPPVSTMHGAPAEPAGDSYHGCIDYADYAGVLWVVGVVGCFPIVVDYRTLPPMRVLRYLMVVIHALILSIPRLFGS